MKQRSAKKIRKWKEKFERERELRQEIRAAAPDILRSKNFRSTRSHVQHGNMTVNDHSMNVAKCSLAISEKLHIPCEKKELIRGALLHAICLGYVIYSRSKPVVYIDHDTVCQWQTYVLRTFFCREIQKNGCNLPVHDLLTYR